jgi:hypothetical protein
VGSLPSIGDKVRREKALDFIGRNSRPQTGSLPPGRGSAHPASMFRSGAFFHNALTLSNRGDPMLMGVHRIGKARSHEQVAPVSLGEFYRPWSFSMFPSLNLSAAKRTRSDRSGVSVSKNGKLFSHSVSRILATALC